MTCPFCNEQIEEPGGFCPHCGERLPPSSAAPTRAAGAAGMDRPPRTASDPKSSQGRDARFIPGTVLAGRYRLVALLGRGGMGEVYRAEDMKLGRTVALKFLPEALAAEPDRLARFFNEVRTALQVTHPNVCRIHDIGEVDGQHFISMEYVDGEDLASLLRRIGHVPKERAIQMARQLCAGLAAAHERGIVHRDLKPANVMVDGRGRIRISDFGLAGLAEEIAGEKARAGTPAYMAPEQLQGRPASVKSDIYALGLVLYEIFTGKPAFGALTRTELMKLHAETTPPPPSSLVEGFDPAVERVISRCLEREPSRRPPSALAVAAALPGGNPLAEALAAGETPSPEMVADAGEAGGVRPARGLLYLVLILALMIVNVFLTSSSDLARILRLPLHPEHLTAKAKEIIRGAGYDAPPMDEARGWKLDYEHILEVRAKDPRPDRWERLAGAIPSPVWFWYRQSPVYLTPLSDSSKVTRDDPPSTIPGMTSVTLDASGRLVEFQRVPASVDANAPTGNEVDYAPLFRAADLDPSLFHPAPPTWHPTLDCQDHAAWTGAYPGQEGVPIRVEACAYGGMAAAFRVIPPWLNLNPLQHTGTGIGMSVFAWSVLGIVGLILAAAGLLARRNLRLGRGDRAGASKLSLFVFSLAAASALLSYHYAPDFGTVPGLFTVVAKSALLAAILWLTYLALEPYARKLWPDALVSWNRALAGRFRDPLVGRDLLVGALFGTLMMFLSGSQGYAIRLAGETAPLRGVPPLDRLLGQREALAAILNSLSSSLLVPAVLVFTLVLLRGFTRRQWVASSSLIALLAILNSTGLLMSVGAGDRSMLQTLLIILPEALNSALEVILIVRFGFMAAIASFLIPTLFSTFPATADLGSWQAGPFWTANLLALALCVYAFVIARAGRPLFGGGLLEQ